MNYLKKPIRNLSYGKMGSINKINLEVNAGDTKIKGFLY